MQLTPRRPASSRRLTSRVNTAEGVSVYWRCNGRDDVLRVRDLSVGGLFLKTPKQQPVGATAQIDFLVQEGRIRADAVVCHVEPTRGLGLKFTAMPREDRPRFGMLITRLRQFRFGVAG